MSAVNYCISWIYGELRIVRRHRSLETQRWEAPALVESPRELVAALDEAGDHIDLTARGDLILLHEHDLHTHEYLETPQMRRRDLEKYLGRRVDQDKSFSEPAAWCHHDVKHRGGKQGVLLHLLPKSLVDGTAGACAAAGLTLKVYSPLTELVSAYLPTTDIETDKLVMVVACFAERTEIILTMGTGEALFVRELLYGYQSDAQRLISDINRTFRYTRQQLSRDPDITLLMGAFDSQHMAQFSDGIQADVRFDEPSSDPFFWAEEASKLKGKLSANYIAGFGESQFNIQSLQRMGVWAIAAALVAAIGMTLLIGVLVAHRGDQIVAITARTETVQAKIQELEEKLAAGQSKQDHLNRLRASSFNLPSLLLVNLSALVPPELEFRQVDIQRESQGWGIQLLGSVPGDLRAGARTLARFEDQLQQPPWQVRLEKSFTNTWMQQFSQGHQGDVGFEIRGTIQ